MIRNIITERISTKFFTYEKGNKTFSTEHSSLPQTFNLDRRIPIVLISKNTGNEAIFSFHKEDRQEGELMGTWFQYCGNDSSLRGLKILIIND